MSCFAKHLQEKVTNSDSAKIENSQSEKLLRAIINNKLSFEEQIKTLSKRKVLTSRFFLLRVDEVGKSPLPNIYSI